MKFVNKNAIKSDFWGDCVEVSRKFSKNPRFWQKSISTKFENFEKYFYRGGVTPPQNIPDVYIKPAIDSPFNHIKCLR